MNDMYTMVCVFFFFSVDYEHVQLFAWVCYEKLLDFVGILDSIKS